MQIALIIVVECLYAIGIQLQYPLIKLTPGDKCCGQCRLAPAQPVQTSLDRAQVATEEFAQEHELLTSGVSDAHTTYELGRTYVEMPEFDGTPDGFKKVLAQGTIVGRRTTPLIHVVTTLTKVKKRLFGGHSRGDS